MRSSLLPGDHRLSEELASSIPFPLPFLLGCLWYSLVQLVDDRSGGLSKATPLFGGRARLVLNSFSMRLDLELTRRGLAPSREAAQRLIMAGLVWFNSRPETKADLKVC